MPPQFQDSHIQPTNVAENISTPKPRSHAFLVALTTLMLISGAYAIWYSFNLPPEPEPENLSVTTDKFADWKTYRDEEYGFEFKYPNDFEVTVTPTNIIEISENPGEKAYPGIWIEANSNPGGLSLIEWWQKTPGDHLQEQIENIKVGGVNVLKIKSSEGLGEDHYLVSFNQKIIDILRIGLNDKVVDQMLSTFKFIDTSTPTQGNYKLGSVLVILEASANRVDFDKFVKDNNLKILLETKNQNLIEIQVPEGQEQIFVDRIKNVTGVESSLLNYYASFDI